MACLATGADLVILRDSGGAALAALTAPQIVALGAKGLDRLDATDDTLLLPTVAQFKALGLVAPDVVEDTVTLVADSGGARHWPALTAAEIGALAAKGVDQLDATDNGCR